jgi:hypothetical protein
MTIRFDLDRSRLGPIGQVLVEEMPQFLCAHLAQLSVKGRRETGVPRWDVENDTRSANVGIRRGVAMRQLLCLVFGHHKTKAVFTTDRFYCRRCGLDL